MMNTVLIIILLICPCNKTKMFKTHVYHVTRRILVSSRPRGSGYWHRTFYEHAMLFKGRDRALNLAGSKSPCGTPADIVPTKTKSSENSYCIYTTMRTHGRGLFESLTIIAIPSPYESKTSSARFVSLRPRGGLRDGTLATPVLFLHASMVGHDSSDIHLSRSPISGPFSDTRHLLLGLLDAHAAHRLM